MGKERVLLPFPSSNVGLWTKLTTEMAVAMENIFLESYKTSLFMENLQDLRMRLSTYTTSRVQKQRQRHQQPKCLFKPLTAPGSSLSCSSDLRSVGHSLVTSGSSGSAVTGRDFIALPGAWPMGLWMDFDGIYSTFPER